MDEKQPTRYWKSLEEKQADAAFVKSAQDEFPGYDDVAIRIDRRDFLRAAGFSLAAVAAAGCSRAPVEKAMPLLVPVEELVPGRALYYATTCSGCSAACGALAKVRDGRPIKLEGNPQHALSRGGLCAAGQGTVLGLYDSQRLQQPLIRGRAASWGEVDAELAAALAPLRQAGAVRFLSSTIVSPTLRAAVGSFLAQFEDARHVTGDALSYSAILDAHQRTHGARLVPHYRFDLAEVIAGFDADFLGTWLSPVEFSAQWRANRAISPDSPRLSFHAHFEPRMTITGSKADRRVALAPEDSGLVLTHLAMRIARLTGTPFNTGSLEASPVSERLLDEVAERLVRARGRSLVVAGANDARVQALVNFINQALGNYGATLELDRPSLQAQGSDADLSQLLAELRDGKVQALFIYGANPAFELPELAAQMARVPLVVSFGQRPDETAALAHYVCPDATAFESWADAEPVAGRLSLNQPAIRPLGASRPALESLAAWSGRPQSSYDLVRAYWEKNVFPRASAALTFQSFWDTALHDGYVEVSVAAPKTKFNADAVEPIRSAARQGDYTVVLHSSVAMLDGRFAYNPWLHELPDPITKVTWDNCATLAPLTAERFHVKEGDLVRVKTERGELDLPAYIQPGQHERVIGVALGYGSKLSARFARIGPQWLDALPSVGDAGVVGVNAAPLLRLDAGRLCYDSPATLSTTGRRRPLAVTQAHHTLSVPDKLRPPDGALRPIVQEMALATFLDDPRAPVYDPEFKEDLWPADHQYTGPRWGMVIDLNACTGCSGCVIACQAENNIPVVGRDEVRRNREMHWVRIDRYYSERDDGQLDVAYQPMLCQQCENAPCETVCPVLATVHSADGLNQQVYNRCIGTRYCANNCPYKGRRFNWFAYSRDDRLQNLVLNPDVTVRSRGVMEKCTFCVQRIQEGKIASKREGRSIADGEVQTACQQSCPAQAIYFGDLNDPKSRVSRAMSDPRRYRVLAELNVKPSVGYLALVRNREADKQEKGNEHHG